MIRAKYIKTMDFNFEDVVILNCSNESEVSDKIENDGVLKIQNGDEIEYIHSAYIMFYALD